VLKDDGTIWTWGVNNSGQLGNQPTNIYSGLVVGTSAIGAPYYLSKGFYWSAETGIKMIGNADLFSPRYSPYAVNAAGQITGTTFQGLAAKGFLRSPDGLFTDLGVLTGNDSTEADTLNDTATVAGVSYGGVAGTRAFIWSPPAGPITLIPMPGGTTISRSSAKSINKTGVVVGSFAGTDQINNAFIYANGTSTNLNELLPQNTGWTLTEAVAVNAAGQIAGNGLANGRLAAFLLTPRNSGKPTPVSPRFVVSSLRADSSGNLEFDLAADPGTSVVIESSIDLTIWSPHSTNQITTPTTTLRLRAQGGTTFFRAKAIP